MKLGELNTILYHERKEKESLVVRCTELLKEVDLLEEHKWKSIKLLAQGNEIFEHMLTMGRESGDRRGLGYELENPNSKSNASTFVKGKGKVASQSTPNPTPTQVFQKVKATCSKVKRCADSLNFKTNKLPQCTSLYHKRK